ncbi:PolC-type DNA polymerase III [Mycoplasmopsis iners]|uniref:PolC-type DNA polymerase III n=1 Tax=Mycoplasmopsis iners TaxID=76630 RepID=UPI00068DDD75|nr:PolC-type DNA polymerase III [Mycoplasmopsis iners]
MIQNNSFLQLCDRLKIPVPDSLKNTEILEISFDPSTDKLKMVFKFNNNVSLAQFKFFKAFFTKKEGRENFDCTFIFPTSMYEMSSLEEYIVNLLQKTKYSLLKKYNLTNYLNQVNDCSYEVILPENDEKEDVIDKLNLLVEKLKNYGYKNLNIFCNFKNNEIVNVEEEQIIKQNEIIDQYLKNKENKPKINRPIESSNNNFFRRSKKMEYQFVPLNELKDAPDKTDIEVQGMIFDQEYKYIPKAEKNKHLYIFSITDLKNGAKLQLFSPNELTEEDQKILAKGNWISAKGRLVHRLHMGRTDINIYIDSYNQIASQAKESVDTATVKRVELHVSSKMNTMDGLLEPEEILKTAKKFNMPAVAIMDANGCQGYPAFYLASKKEGVKPIYGTAFSVINRNVNIVLGNFQNVKLRDTGYLSFDIETSSLFPRFGDLIEYGAVSISESLRINNPEQFFVKARKPISSFTTNLTGITNEMLNSSGINTKEALQKIYESLNNKIALAHNARFDYHFLKQKFYENQMEFPNVAVIDTLKVSRLLFPNDSKHRLKDLANKVGINYNDEEAHRGDYDADVLANVWLQLISLLEAQGIDDLAKLASYTSDALYKREFSYEASTIAKNNQGLREQFELVSLASTDQYYSQPKLYWDQLKEKSNILVGSGTLKSKLLDDYFYGSHELFLQTIDNYDYVEIPAPQVFDHWITYGDITQEELLNSLAEIISIAKAKNKIVVATADVKYQSEIDHKAYEIVVYAKGIGNSRHYLYNYEKARNNTLKVPKQHFLSTNEMLEQFSFLKDEQLIKEIVIDNTNKIANMCENIEVIKKGLFKPEFDNSPVKLKDLVYKTAHEKYGEILPEFIEKRIQSELDPIIEHGFSVIYWISHVLIKKSVENGFIVGSRGSVGSSIVAYLSGVSQVNPLPSHYLCPKCKKFILSDDKNITSGFDLDPINCPDCGTLMETDGQTIPFETFLGFNADKVPDIDLNFSGIVQGEIHKEVRNLFGVNKTFKAGTVQTVAAKTAFGYVKNYCEETKTELDDVYMNYLSNKIDGIKRTTSQHPGGIIIVPQDFDLFDITPINYPAGDIGADWKTTHFDYKAIHDNLLKLDILGHDNPTIIKLLEDTTGIKTDQIPKKDKKVISIFSSTKELGISPEDIGGETTGALGLPEFGTDFVRRMLSTSNPQSFADLVSLSGLSHGTNVWTDNAEDLVVKRGFTLSDVISYRDDILVKLMAQGVPRTEAFSIMENVRKGKGLKPEEEALLNKYNVPDWQIDSMKKIKYMFPKAHAVAYVLMAWWIAYYKVYHPLEFYATYFTAHADVFDLDHMIDFKAGTKVKNRLRELIILNNKNIISSTEKKLIPIMEIAQELYARGYNIANVSLEKSHASEWLVDHENKCLIPPFNAINSLGLAVATSITSAREDKTFLSIEDLRKRTQLNNTLEQKLKDMGVLNNLDKTNQMSLF